MCVREHALMAPVNTVIWRSTHCRYQSEYVRLLSHDPNVLKGLCNRNWVIKYFAYKLSCRSFLHPQAILHNFSWLLPSFATWQREGHADVDLLRRRFGDMEVPVSVVVASSSPPAVPLWSRKTQRCK